MPSRKSPHASAPTPWSIDDIYAASQGGRDRAPTPAELERLQQHDRQEAARHAFERFDLLAEVDTLRPIAHAYHDRRQRTHTQTQEAARLGVDARRKPRDQWRTYARKAHARGGDETPIEMAKRISGELFAAGWVSRADWKDISKFDRTPGMGYVPTVDTIVRFLRELTKN